MLSLEKPIRLRPGMPVDAFLHTLRRCAERSPDYEEVEAPAEGDLELVPLLPHHHRNLSIRFDGSTAAPEVVVVHLYADWWEPRLDYETYATAGRELLEPLLRQYNRAHGTHLRMMAPEARRPPHLPAGAKVLFETHCAVANKGCAHPLDWSSFYEFILHCHERRVLLDAEGVKAMLLSRGFTAEAADELAAAYGHTRGLLAWRRSPERLRQKLRQQC